MFLSLLSSISCRSSFLKDVKTRIAVGSLRIDQYLYRFAKTGCARRGSQRQLPSLLQPRLTEGRQRIHAIKEDDSGHSCCYFRAICQYIQTNTY